MSRWREGEAVARAVHRDLVGTGLLSPLVLGGTDEALWTDCDLASFAENRLHERVGPRELSEALKRDWTARAIDEQLWTPSQRNQEVCYWLHDGDARAGTLAIGDPLMGSSLWRVSSLYVFPSVRGRSLARRVLTAIRDVLGQHGQGLNLTTNWTWQRAARLYLRMGMWVQGWKREIEYRWVAAEPTPNITFGSTDASLRIREGDGETTLAWAHRQGDHLVSMDLDASRPWDAESTLSLAMAFEGWPLVRSQERWEHSRTADLGPPEALANKIRIWEAWEEMHGWHPQTPRIPGLDYPTWKQLEAEWGE